MDGAAGRHKIGFPFDGWSRGTTHYVALFAVSPYNSSRKQRLLLAMQPLFNENQTEANHDEFISGFIEYCNRNTDDILFLLIIAIRTRE